MLAEMIKKLPEYSPDMFLQGYTAEEIMEAFRRSKRREMEEQNDEDTMNVKITTEVKK